MRQTIRTKPSRQIQDGLHEGTFPKRYIDGLIGFVWEEIDPTQFQWVRVMCSLEQKATSPPQNLPDGLILGWGVAATDQQSHGFYRPIFWLRQNEVDRASESYKKAQTPVEAAPVEKIYEVGTGDFDFGEPTFEEAYAERSVHDATSLGFWIAVDESMHHSWYRRKAARLLARWASQGKVRKEKSGWYVPC